MILFLALAAGLLVAWFAYWRLEGLGMRAWPAALCRASAVATVIVLAMDLGWRGTPDAGGRPVVLLDASLSMSTLGAPWTQARDSAAAWGEVRVFGDPAAAAGTVPSAGRSDLRPALTAALALGRPVIVVTDGEVTDGDELERDLLQGVGVRIFPRQLAPGVAMARLDGPAIVSEGDTARFEAEALRFGGLGDSAQVDLLVGTKRVFRRPVRFGVGDVTRLAFDVPTAGLRGETTVQVVVRAPDDQERRDNMRWAVLRVTPAPGIVMLASPPDWDSRFLYRTLRDVSELPVRGFLEIRAGVWRDMDRLQAVPTATVRRSARGADVLVLKGSTGGPAAGIRPRGLWLWPSGAGGEAQLGGEWYAAGRAGSPVSDAFVGFPVDSFPPLGPITPIEPSEEEWVGLVAQLGRRGAERPILTGGERGGSRRALTAAEGLWRWAFRGGASEQSYRALVASTVSWLVGGRDGAGGIARPVRTVVPNGRPLTFKWNGTGSPRPAPIEFRSGDMVLGDTLRFDAGGRAEVRLPPGSYRYEVAGGGGTVVTEEWSEEFLPHPQSVETSEPAARGVPRSVSAREWLGLFAFCIACLAGEWWFRHRLGLR
jgi:hypothetical protein